MLTRRRDREATREKCDVYYDDVRVGSIGQRAGVPNPVDQGATESDDEPGATGPR